MCLVGMYWQVCSQLMGGIFSWQGVYSFGRGGVPWLGYVYEAEPCLFGSDIFI